MTTDARFDYFVVFAEMRTGSNLLEANLNEFDGITCLGEVFNPGFMGHEGARDVLGVTLDVRERNPLTLLRAIMQAEGLTGFRFFHDHDPRVLPHILADPRCAKIVLTRNPLDSYVSLKIAQATQQWKLGDVKTKRSAQVTFDPVEFEAYVRAQQEFQVHLQNKLQVTGQTAFYVAYEDANDVAVLNGLAAWLGVGARIEAPSSKLKRQNPEPLEQKLTNVEAVRDGLARLDRFNLGRTPSFEPRRGGMIWAHRACRTVPLVYAPLNAGHDGDVLGWMAQIDGGSADDLLRDFTPESWADWQRSRPGHAAFTLIRHPLERAHHVFRTQILHGNRENVRAFLARVHDVHLPSRDQMAGFDQAAHRAAFAAYLRFCHSSLNGQTSLVVQGAWATQSALLAGIVTQCPLALVLRAEHFAQAVPVLGAMLGRDLPAFAAPRVVNRLMLDQVYDPEIEALGRLAYAADYQMLGFGDWRP
ncbi:MAG: nodulation protein NodH [Roseinatronobacter sp.]